MGFYYWADILYMAYLDFIFEWATIWLGWLNEANRLIYKQLTLGLSVD